MSKEKSSLGKGSTRLMKSVKLDMQVFMDVDDSVEDLVKFVAEFFCEMGDYTHLEFSVQEEKDLLQVPTSIDKN